MKQPKCPWCGMGFRGDQSDLWHVEGFREEGRCGSQWFPDFDGGLTEGRKQSEACREIARLKIAHLRRMADLAGIRANDVLRDQFRLASKCVRRSLRFTRVQNGCLAKITELKESQCSTKS